MALRKIQQNPERYTQQGNRWAVQSAPQIIPIILEGGTQIGVKPVIKAQGIVVKVGNDYLVSPQTLRDIQDSKNPHWNIQETGQISNAGCRQNAHIHYITPHGTDAGHDCRGYHWTGYARVSPYEDSGAIHSILLLEVINDRPSHLDYQFRSHGVGVG